MQNEEIHITLSGQASQKLRAAFPSRHLSLDRKAGKITVQWFENSVDIKAAVGWSGRPNHSAWAR